MNLKLNKTNLPEYSEGSIFKTFASQTSTIFNKSNLVYNTEDDTFYKVVDLKTDDDYKPTWASLVSKDGSKKLEIDSKSKFDQFQNFIDIIIQINGEGRDSAMIEARIKLYDKLESALEHVFTGAGVQLMAYKLYFKGEFLEKDKTIALLDNIIQGDTIYASMGFGKPYTFKRFPKVYTNYGWSNSGSYPDGIAFLPQQSVKI